MPAIGVNITDDNDTALSPALSISLSNTAQNTSSEDNTTVNNNTCGNLTGLLTVNYVLDVESPDTAWIIEITSG